MNVNFPESAVQKATDDYVRDLYRAKEKGKPGTTEVSPSASPKVSLADLVLLSAWADSDEVFKVNTDGALKISERLRSRISDVIKYKHSGALGETNDGLLVLKQSDQLKRLEIQRVDQLVKAENTDRMDLYNEVLRANNLPKPRLINVQRSFARSFQAESPSGTWVESTEGRWAQKP